MTITGRPESETKRRSNGSSPIFTPSGLFHDNSCLSITLGLTVKLCVTRGEGLVALSPAAKASRVHVPAFNSEVVIVSPLSEGKQIVGVNEFTVTGKLSDEVRVLVTLGLSKF